MAVGTMVFMAPETFTDLKAELDQQTDVWALGVILMWIVTALELLGRPLNLFSSRGWALCSTHAWTWKRARSST